MGSWFSDAVHAANRGVWNTPEALPWLVVALLGSGLYVTLRLRFVQLRRLRHSLRVIRGVYDNPEDKGDINHFQALATALSATVGIGNIAGVAIAVHLGGPGALFWMWITALFGMALKFSECTLAIRYRTFDAAGQASGGPMYYIEKGLGSRYRALGMTFAMLAIVASFGGGNMNQANTVAVSARSDLGLPPPIAGAIVALVVGVVILGGIKRIGRVTSRLTPAMACLYVAGALTSLVLHARRIPSALASIVHDAFRPRASAGGSVAGSLMSTVVWGIKRGLYSNEAGQGSAPIAHAAAKTEEPAREGSVAMIGPLIDTLMICTLTGLVLLVTGAWDEKHPVELPVARVAVVPRTALPSPGQATEHQRIRAALSSVDERGSAFDTTIEVQGGRQEVVAFVANDGLIEQPQLLDRHGRPFTGIVHYDGRAGGLRDAGGRPAALRVSGLALQTSSALTAAGFRRGLAPLGDWGSYVVTLAVFLFAISTIIGWSYYGERCTSYLLGQRGIVPYRALYVCFSFIGAWLGLEIVWSYGDLALGLMTVPNLIAVVALTGRSAESARDYFSRMRQLDAG